MHPVHAVQQAMRNRPATVHDLVDQLPGLGLPCTRTVDNDDAGAQIRDALSAARSAMPNLSASADPVPGSARGWTLQWSSGWHVLMGELYVQNHSDLDILSPLVLLNRHTHNAYYGPQVVELGNLALAAAAVYQVLTGAVALPAPPTPTYI